MFLRPRSARSAPWRARARRALLLRLRAGSCVWSSRESDDLGLGSRIARMASAGRDRRTCGDVLAGLIDDERVEIGVGKHLARTLATVTDDDVTQRARGDVPAQGLEAAA